MPKYWYLWALIIILIPITVYVCYRAAMAAKQAREEREKTIEELNNAKSLKDEFSGISASDLQKADDKRVLPGIALLIDLKLRKEIKPKDAFEKLSVKKQLAYTLNCILEDTNGSVSAFFKRNTEPVSPLASKALKAAGLDSLAELFDEVYPMYDDDNESVSLDEEKIKAADEKFGRLFDKDVFISSAARFIKENASEFTGGELL
ncbi:MAG: DMP19 family protein [Clostridiales bacterium]|nr:hypothetical protein [Clostridia bacterium]MCR4563450.1 DMP19 family protein [Clostridiales bacterium]